MKKGSGKRKGSAFERKISKVLDEYWGVKPHTFWRARLFKNKQTFGDISVQYSQDQGDIWFPFIIECKAYKSLDLLQFLNRTESTKLFQWWKQLTEATIEAKKYLRFPRRLLIIKINNFPILSAYCITELPERSVPMKTFRLHIGDDLVSLCLFSDFQKVYTRKYLENTIKVIQDG